MNTWLYDGTIDRELASMQDTCSAAESDVATARKRWYTAQDDQLAAHRAYELAGGADRDAAQGRLVMTERALGEAGSALELAKQKVANAIQGHRVRSQQVDDLRSLDTDITTAHDHLHAAQATIQDSRSYQGARLTEEITGYHNALDRLSGMLRMGAPDVQRISNELRPIQREAERLYRSHASMMHVA